MHTSMLKLTRFHVSYSERSVHKSIRECRAELCQHMLPPPQQQEIQFPSLCGHVVRESFVCVYSCINSTFTINSWWKLNALGYLSRYKYYKKTTTAKANIHVILSITMPVCSRLCKSCKVLPGLATLIGQLPPLWLNFKLRLSSTHFKGLSHASVIVYKQITNIDCMLMQIN